VARAQKTRASLVRDDPQSRAQRFEALISSVAATNIDSARSLARQVVEGWWQMLVPSGHTVSLPDFPLALPAISPGVAMQARAFGGEIATLRAPDAVAEIGRLYSHALPTEHRSQHGIFYTPPALVSRLLDQAELGGLNWQKARVISPSCGAGAFLVEDAARMVGAMGGADPAILIASIGGRLRAWDRDPFACWLSQVAVEAVVLPQMLACGRRLPPIAECRDSLMEDWSDHAGEYDLVNENPAFGKVKKSPDLEKRFSRSQRGHMNWYGLFADLAIHLAKPDGGIIAYLTPTSYLSGDYFSKLRGLLWSTAPPISIDLVDSRQDVFPDVLQEVALSVFVRGPQKKSAKCASVHVEPDGLRINEVGELDPPTSAEAPWFIARSPKSVPIVAAMQAMPARLADWGYRVKTGPLVPHKNEPRMHAEKAEGRLPVVWAESISPTGGRFSIRCDRPGRKAWYQPKGNDDSNVTTEAALLLQRTTAKEQARRLIGAVMSVRAVESAGGRVAVENHVNMMVPSVESPGVSLNELARFFASAAADRAFRCVSGSVAVSATELESLPLPSIGDLGAALKSVDPDRALCRLYGMDDAVAPQC
jgi:adenine-specific DNA-methyltransferase